jgi:Fe-S-cluster-containing hydrogenase component 2
MALMGVAETLPDRKLVRPPGVSAEKQFLETCVRCKVCVDVCPVKGLELAHLGDGFKNVGTPKLTGYCMVFKGLEKPDPIAASEWKTTVRDNGEEVACYECIRQCPSRALHALEPDKLRMGIAVVNKETCLAWVHGACGYPCLRTCPFDAIVADRGPVVDEEKCVGCNQCYYVCLTHPSSIAVMPRAS